MISSTDTTYDSDIDSLIAEMQPGIEYTIADVYLEDVGNLRLQAVLRLGMLEIISGEFIQQLYRESGASEAVKVGSLTIGARPEHGLKLIQQGVERLRPFRKAIDGLADEPGISVATRSERAFTADRMRDW
jgi:hypothetical protein